MKHNSFSGSGKYGVVEQVAVVGVTLLCIASCQQSLSRLNQQRQTPTITIQPLVAETEIPAFSTMIVQATALPVLSMPMTTATATTTQTPVLDTETPIPPTETETPTSPATDVSVSMATQKALSLPTALPVAPTMAALVATPIPGALWNTTDVVVAPQPTVESIGRLAPGNGANYTYTVHDQYIGRIETRIVKTEIYKGSLTVLWVSVVSSKDFVADLCFMPCKINFTDGTFIENIGFVIPDGSHFRFEPGKYADVAGNPYGRHYTVVFLPKQEVIFGVVFKSDRIDTLQSVEIPTMHQTIRFVNVFVPYFAEAYYKTLDTIKEQAKNAAP